LGARGTFEIIKFNPSNFTSPERRKDLFQITRIEEPNLEYKFPNYQLMFFPSHHNHSAREFKRYLKFLRNKSLLYVERDILEVIPG
jgi:hypothetical protein